MKIETYLPIFPGFYGTDFDCNEEDQICEEENLEYSEINWNYKDYRERVAIASCQIIEEYLKHDGFNFEFKFQEVVSPREYNFVNDSINVEVILLKTEFNILIGYLKSNLSDFKEFLEEHYTSRSGFCSFYETAPEIWINEYLKPSSDKYEHCFGAVLGFYLINEGFTEDELLSQVSHETGTIDWEVKEELIEME
ncbi:hypothetical protein Phi4:1_gp141 [Cellulophaga phage phi4:1]|uniref:Uncharacterized protein n=5 Tax=Lightbulbvirus TaxID=1918522 RepID=A0A0S2MWR7_9CAUD|nr:hypothetical protein Phi4:1_gp141 [Cellulophaga phage phi4:1]YP_008241640.1 hypothetical protein Phi17:2_gp145 [Cellulophaga phage phi17:2]ALO80150.1 hypothetical protein Phi4113_141 [Cellulophaga phage phi4:1_13]ALO80347.1 hypothetical protein Phi4118_141 [Cellulophaga phage phi4:1_18]ALO80548.1 hypothetical protein Phi17218_145 [Cellulophaga phage phi17:2_18]AGO47678.1 hypothetical protein Phi17:2_gp145 [Cellulophaga phage phi17:2]AGO49554.1 hypothetical protein Phi4:1_gp141 [Cellulophag